MDRIITLAIDVRNFALVTHAVPAKRVRPHVPERFELQTFRQDREEMCFVTATCFCNENFRWSALPYPRITFNESTYRTYVVLNGCDGVFFIGRYLSSPLALAAQRALDHDVWLGDFEVETAGGSSGAPARGRSGVEAGYHSGGEPPYESYTCSVASAKGNTSFELTATERPGPVPPFRDGYEHSQFMTYRLHGFYTSVTGGAGYMPVSHAHMDPYAGTLLSGRFDLWHELGILEGDEDARPHSVLAQPYVRFKLYPPRPAWPTLLSSQHVDR